MIVLDSSAMLAYLKNEAGGDLVRDLLLDEERDVPVYAHAINLAEVFYNASLLQNVAAAEKSIATLKEAGVIERNDMDAEFWRDIASIITARRKEGGKLALGDACGLALARREDGEFYSSDRAELEPIHRAGVCRVTFIR